MPSTFRRFVPLFLALNALPVRAQPISFHPIEVPVGYATSSFVVADLNGDGIPDIVATYADSAQTGINRMVALLGKGDGSFVTHPIDCDFGSSAPDPFLTAGIVVAALDVNGDGTPDLLATNTSPVSPRTILLIGNGDGTFQPSKVVSSDILRRVADFNGDGKPDLLLFAENTNTFSVRLGNGDGAFQPPLTVGSMPFVVSLAVGDFNKDGKLDIAFAKGAFTDQGFIWIWPGNGDGTFGAVFPVSSSIGVSARAYPLMAVDFNGDGKLDLPLTIDSALPFVTPPHGADILFGNGDWTFRSVKSPPSFGNSQGFGDFNGDGRLDVAIDSSVMLGAADGILQPQIFFGPAHFIGYRGVEFAFYPGVVAADLNRDGKMDFVAFSGNTGTPARVPDVAQFLPGGFTVLLNTGAGPSHSVTAYSAADGLNVLAPDSIGSIYGEALASVTQSAGAADLPTSLGGVRVHVRDVNGVDRLAALLYVSPSQINFVVPALTAEGFAALNVDDGSVPYTEGIRSTPIQNVAPALFTADGTGTGVAAASAVRVAADGTQTPVPVFTCTNGKCVPVPIDLSGDPVYLSLYGTGFRRSDTSSTAVSCEIVSARMNAATTYVGPQGTFPGLDQLNIRLPKLSGAGETDLVCQFSYDSSERIYHSNAYAPPVRVGIK